MSDGPMFEFVMEPDKSVNSKDPLLRDSKTGIVKRLSEWEWNRKKALNVPSCKCCCFYEGSGYGECLRYPPVVVMRENQRDHCWESCSEFPEVDENWKCGEFKEKPPVG